MFQGQYYLQLLGVSMGARHSPSVANLVMSWFEERYIFSPENVFGGGIVWYGRYIDDILLVWGRDVSAVPDFVNHCNSNPFNLSFTYYCDHNTINFLDLTLRGIPGKLVLTNTYVKPLSGNTVLRANSNHPPHTIKAIPVGELIRAKRNCNTAHLFEQESSRLLSNFRARGYGDPLLNRARNKVQDRNRDSLLVTHVNVNKHMRSKQPCLILQYSPYFQAIKSIVLKYLPILHSDAILKNILSKGCKVVSRWAPTLGTFLSPNSPTTRSSTTPRSWLSTKGFYKCAHTVCKTCSFVSQTKIFFDSTGTQPYHIKSFMNCETKFAIYQISCITCNLSYIGCTTRKIKNRFLDHLRDIVGKVPVGRVPSAASVHFTKQHGGSVKDLRICGIESIGTNARGGDRHRLLLKREAFWIFQLNTVFPQGLNHRSEIENIY